MFSRTQRPDAGCRPSIRVAARAIIAASETGGEREAARFLEIARGRTAMKGIRRSPSSNSASFWPPRRSPSESPTKSAGHPEPRDARSWPRMTALRERARCLISSDSTAWRLALVHSVTFDGLPLNFSLRARKSPIMSPRDSLNSAGRDRTTSGQWWFLRRADGPGNRYLELLEPAAVLRVRSMPQ